MAQFMIFQGKNDSWSTRVVDTIFFIPLYRTEEECYKSNFER